MCTQISNLYLTCGGSSTLALIFEKFSCTEIPNAWANGSFLKASLRDFKASLIRFCLKSGLTAVTLIIFLVASSPKNMRKNQGSFSNYIQRLCQEFYLGGSKCQCLHVGGSKCQIFNAFKVSSKILGGSIDPLDPPLTTPLQVVL